MNDPMQEAGLGVPPRTADEWRRYYDAKRAKADDALSEAGLGVSIPPGAICVCGAMNERGHAQWCKGRPGYKAPMTLRECMEAEEGKRSALATQEGGDHYKTLKIQPVEYIHANGVGYFEGNVIKYVTRWRAKNGLQDLKKARHYLDLLIELEQKAAQ